MNNTPKPAPNSVENIKIKKTDDENNLDRANIIYLTATGIAAFFGVVAIIASYYNFIYGERVSTLQKLQLAQAKEHTAKLEAQAAPREIGPPQTYELEKLAQERRVVRVSSYTSDAESARLAELILARLNALGIETEDDILTHLATKPIAFGVQVTSEDTEFGDALRRWLSESDLLRQGPLPIMGGSSHILFMSGANDSTEQKPSAIIFVGVKPLPQ
jgi:hypothetical protein